MIISANFSYRKKMLCPVPCNCKPKLTQLATSNHPSIRIRSGTTYCRFDLPSICSAQFFLYYLHHIQFLIQQILHFMYFLIVFSIIVIYNATKSFQILLHVLLHRTLHYCSLQLHCIHSNYLTTFFQLYLQLYLHVRMK